MALIFLFGKQGMEYAQWVEIAAVVGVGLLAVVLMRLVGNPVEYVDDIEASIAEKARGALMYAVMSANGCLVPFSLICLPASPPELPPGV
jgi:hypothetical protein